MAIKLNEPSVIILTEVAPKNTRYALQKSELEIKGYQLFCNDFTNKKTRGLKSPYVLHKL